LLQAPKEILIQIPVLFKWFDEKKEEGRQTKNIWLAEEKNTLNAPFRKYVETM